MYAQVEKTKETKCSRVTKYGTKKQTVKKFSNVEKIGAEQNHVRQLQVIRISRDVTDYGTHNFVTKHYLPVGESRIAETMAEQRLLDSPNLMRSSVLYGISEEELVHRLEDAVRDPDIYPAWTDNHGWQYHVTLSNLHVADASRVQKGTNFVITSNEVRDIPVTLKANHNDPYVAPNLVMDNDLVITPCHWGL